MEKDKMLPSTIVQAVADIKTAILQSQQRVASQANAELLSLYYGIGRYISGHTRSGA
jgi:hypothetical protein